VQDACPACSLAEAEHLYLDIVSIMEATHDPNLGSALHGLADVYARMGLDEKLFAAEQQAARADEKAFGPESYQVAVDWNDLGVAYDRAGSTSDAARSDQRCLQLLKKLPGRHKSQEFTVYANLGYLYLWADRTAKSESAFSHGLKIAKRDPSIRPTAIAQIRSELVKLNRVDQVEQAAEQDRIDRAPGPANIDPSLAF